MSIKWIEEYQECGCSFEAGRKKDLLGYCAVHGTDATHRYKLSICTWCNKAAKDDNVSDRYQKQNRWVHRVIGKRSIRWVDCKASIEFQRVR